MLIEPLAESNQSSQTSEAPLCSKHLCKQLPYKTVYSHFSKVGNKENLQSAPPIMFKQLSLASRNKLYEQQPRYCITKKKKMCTVETMTNYQCSSDNNTTVENTPPPPSESHKKVVVLSNYKSTPYS